MSNVYIFTNPNSTLYFLLFTRKQKEPVPIKPRHDLSARNEFITALCARSSNSSDYLNIVFAKFILLPIQWIIGNVILYYFKRMCVANNMVVKTRLPAKIGVYFTHFK